MRKELIVGNWKMNGAFEMAQSLVQDIVDGTEGMNSVDIVICPPHPYLQHVAQLISHTSNIALGAQNCSEHAAGAYTGEVSSKMLQDARCKYVICGHSERRRRHGETDDEVARKTLAVIAQGLTPIACVGETLGERQSGKTRMVIERQIDSVLQHCGEKSADRLAVAYEPVWAIGTGESAAPEQAQEVHSVIRARIAQLSDSAAGGCRILYGGSVTGENAASILGQPDVDGCLVGGASLKSVQFLQICEAAVRG